MKRLNLKVAALLLMGSVVYSSCIGSFALFNKYAKWQRTMTGNKYVNGIVGIFLQPIVGVICLFVDGLIINTIEFWSGSNPVQANIGKTQQVVGSDGRAYAVTTLEDGYEVKASTGEVTLFKHVAETDAWTVTQNGQTKELFRYNADGTITASVRGQDMTFTADQQGLYQARMAAGGGLFFAVD